MARKRATKGNMNGSLLFIHRRDTSAFNNSTAICGKMGVHTSKKQKDVTCQMCIDKTKKIIRKVLDK